MSVGTAEMVARAERAGLCAEPRGGLINLVVDQNRIVLQTGAESLRESRQRALLAGVAAAAAGCALLFVSPWAALVVLAGLAYAGLAPRRIRPVPFASVDTESECLIGSNAVPLKEIVSIRGAFETKGWDGFSVVSAVLSDEAVVPILLLLGADERLARAVCAELGGLANCPAEYTGTSGKPVTCYSPAPNRPPLFRSVI